MTITPKHQKVLAMASSPTGAPIEVYTTQCNELVRAGLVVRKEVFSKAGGNRKIRLFLAEAA